MKLPLRLALLATASILVGIILLIQDEERAPEVRPKPALVLVHCGDIDSDHIVG